MRSRLLLIVASAMICLIGCKKDNKSAPNSLATTKTEIIGTWIPVDGVVNGYDPAGKLVNSVKQIMMVDDNYSFLDSIHVQRSFDKTKSYTLTEENGKVYLRMQDNSRTYEVTIKSTMMTWVYTEDYTSQPGYKLVGTLHFKKSN